MWIMTGGGGEFSVKLHRGGRATSPTLAQVRLSPFSSQPSWAQGDKANLKMDLGGLELKLQEVHFAVKFSEVEAKPRLKSIWLQSVPSAVSTQCQWGDCQVHRAELARQGVIGSLWVDIGEELVN